MKLQHLLLFAIVAVHFIKPTQGKTKKRSYEICYKWKQIDYNYDCAPETREKMIQQKKYIPENNVIRGPKISGNRMFLAVSRLLPGVPSSLNWVPYNKTIVNTIGPLLNPYPSWEMQEIGNCKVFQSVVAMEIDQYNRLWIIDNGRINNFAPKPINECPPKLVLIDLNKDKVIYTYIFPADIISRTNSLPVDVTLACRSREDCMLHIPDNQEYRIILFDYFRKRSWFVTHSTMHPDPKAGMITILGKTANLSGIGVGMVGLAPRNQNYNTLYSASVAGFTIYKVNMSVIMSTSCGSTLPDKDIVKVITRPFHTYGMTMDARGRLYYGSLENCAVETLNTTARSLKENVLAHNDADFHSPNTFGFDNVNKELLLVTDRYKYLEDYNLTKYNFNEYNFRVIRFKNIAKSYIY